MIVGAFFLTFIIASFSCMLIDAFVQFGDD